MAATADTAVNNLTDSVADIQLGQPAAAPATAAPVVDPDAETTLLLCVPAQEIVGFAPTPGVLQLAVADPAALPIGFSRVQHVVHDVDFFAEHMSTKEGLVLRGFSANDARRYSGEPLCWFTPQVSAQHHNERVPSLSGTNSRYGTLRISIDWNALLALLEAAWKTEARWHNLGSRIYNQEHCHSLLLSPNDVVLGCGDAQTPYPAFELSADSKPVASTEMSAAARTWRWTIGRHTAAEWDQLDFALHLREPLCVPWSAVQLSLVAHTGFCVPRMGPAGLRGCSRERQAAVDSFAKHMARCLHRRRWDHEPSSFQLRRLKRSLAHHADGLYADLRRAARTHFLVFGAKDDFSEDPELVAQTVTDICNDPGSWWLHNGNNDFNSDSDE